MDMFSMGMGSFDVPSFDYPDIPEYGIREKLLMEKDASGMYFSGHMLDNYSKHVEALDSITTAELCEKSDDGELIYSDKDKVKLVGIISSVSLKTTKNDDRMAFFNLEDKFGEVECIVFPKKYNEFYPDIIVDSAIYVEGTVSIKDDDEPKLLINNITPLIENERYVEHSAPKGKPEELTKAQTDATVEAPAQNTGAPDMINMYLSMYGMATGSAAQQPAPKTAPKAIAPTRVTTLKEATATPQKIYLRVPDMSGEVFKKAKNMVDIFNEGTITVIFYDSSTAKYSEYSERMYYSEYAIKELKGIIGEDNVVTK
jgi:DNA polymerase III alpha subunit